MTDQASAERCEVSLLVPHPSRTAVLVADRGPAASSLPPTLPILHISSSEPSLPDILARVDVVDTAQTAALRLVTTSTAGTQDRGADKVSLIVEFDATAMDPPTGWRWHDLDAEVIKRLEPESARAMVASWVRERIEGWSHLRPQWSLPLWFSRASTWIVEQMKAIGEPIEAAPRQHYLWGLSVVLRASSASGDVYFKCSTDAFRHEAVATQALAARMPDSVPEVIAVDGPQGWILMRDLGAPVLGDENEAMWPKGVVAHAGIQQSWLGRTDELIALGLPSRSLVDLGAQVEAMAQDPVLLGRMSPVLRRQWLATAPTFVESCGRLDEIAPACTLVHGDFHPWNVVAGPTTTRVFDWTDAAVSHPFVDLATYVSRAEDMSVRQRLVDEYVACWSSLGSAEALREAAALGLVVGALYQVQTYRQLLPTLMAMGGEDGLADGDLQWINRALTFHEHGLLSPT